MQNEFEPTEGEGEQTEAIDTVVMLPNDTTATDIADGCREAALTFINESKHWGKAELGMWLTGTYSALTQHGAKEPGQVWPVPLLRDIDARLIDRIMESARTEIFETLALISRDGSASFVLRALIAGAVIRRGRPARARSRPPASPRASPSACSRCSPSTTSRAPATTRAS